MCLYFRMLLYPCIEEELGQARSLVNVMRRRQAIFFGQKGRFRTSYHYGKARGKTRHGNAERKNDGQCSIMDEYRKDNVSDSINQGSWNLERYSRQGHGTGHLNIVMQMRYGIPPILSSTISNYSLAQTLPIIKARF